MAAATEVAPVQQRSHAAAGWRVVAGWLGLLFQILLRIIRSTPSSWAQLLSFVGLRHPLLPVAASPEVAFVQLPSEAPADASPPPLRRLTFGPLEGHGSVGNWNYGVIRNNVVLIKGIYASVAGLMGRGRYPILTSEFADLVLFTAGLEGYAKPLVDRIDAHNRFTHRLYRPSTVTTEYREHVKDLSCLSKDFQRIVLVDNNPYSFLLQPLNGIPCITFSAGQPVDDQLMGTIFPLLEHLALQKDVRPALYETFHMPEWFQRQGIPQIEQAL
ncbi:unnamed protein product [Miscanthus lutarioriparius]|uniref:Mitochondrial import inner membrane translocase subunit TIM50 n=1 Tax=Miscanthus lutarioriparius TaxID=422564 RepID=A0A811SQH5_9POAL|nr:unnamed protein product [Miscanthus lutarioriparius]